MKELMSPLWKFKIFKGEEFLGYEWFTEHYGWVHQEERDHVIRHGTFPNDYTRELGVITFRREEVKLPEVNPPYKHG